MKLIIITGGIGSGKSVLSRLVSVMGYPTYDCDREAKRLMNESDLLKSQLIALLGREAYDSETGRLDRAYVASRIFADKQLLEHMNSIVHPAVRDDLHQWLLSQHSPLAFAETALLSESGLEAYAHRVWVVDAPPAVRIARVMQRSSMTAAQVEARISSQSKDFEFSGAIHIVNDGNTSLIEQVVEHLGQELC